MNLFALLVTFNVSLQHSLFIYLRNATHLHRSALLLAAYQADTGVVSPMEGEEAPQSQAESHPVLSLSSGGGDKD